MLKDYGIADTCKDIRSVTIYDVISQSLDNDKEPKLVSKNNIVNDDVRPTNLTYYKVSDIFKFLPDNQVMCLINVRLYYLDSRSVSHGFSLDKGSIYTNVRLHDKPVDQMIDSYIVGIDTGELFYAFMLFKADE